MVEKWKFFSHFSDIFNFFEAKENKQAKKTTTAICSEFL
jgi:hypothetical protein